jgi:hypothetical protein
MKAVKCQKRFHLGPSAKSESGLPDGTFANQKSKFGQIFAWEDGGIFGHFL